MAGKVLSITKRLDYEEHLDRLRAYHLGISYSTYVKRNAELKRQAEAINKHEKSSTQYRS
jgi:hypothetical protein